MARTSRKEQVTSIVKEKKDWNLALYVRLSVEDNGLFGGDSVNNQLELIQKFVKQMKNVSKSYTYIDNGSTGTNFDREQWERLITDIKNGKINCIVVKDLSRFARNYIEAGDYLEKIFPFLGVRFIAINDCYDSSKIRFKENELTVSLKNLINDYYAKDISKKVISSFSTKKRNGEFIGSMAPYGYTLKENHFIIDPEAATIVKKIYDSFLQGKSGYEIAKLLNTEQVPSPSKYAYERGMKKYKNCQNVLWQQQAVARILYNETYTGKLIQYKTNCSQYSNEKKGLRPREEWKVVPNAHEAIIEENIFEFVQQTRLKNQKVKKERCNRKKKNKSENILKGYIFCGICGHSIRRNSTVRKGKAEYAYYCATKYSHNDVNCTTSSISENKLFYAILACIKAQTEMIIEADSLLQHMQFSILKSKEYQTLSDRISATQAGYKRISALKVTLYENYRERILTKEEYMIEKDRYTAQLEDLENIMAQDKKKRMLYEKSVANQNKLIQSFKAFQNAQDITREMIETLVKKIELFPDKRVQITFSFEDEYKSVLHKEL